MAAENQRRASEETERSSRHPESNPPAGIMQQKEEVNNTGHEGIHHPAEGKYPALQSSFIPD
jgi:hypothetical protein